MRSTGSALGTGLVVAGGAIAVLFLLWLGGFAIQGAGAPSTYVFGIALMLLIAGPLVGVGLYLRGRGAQEASQTALLTERRAVLDADATLRRELVRELDQLIVAVRPSAGALTDSRAANDAERALRLVTDVRDDLARPGYSSATWLETAAGLSREQLGDVRRYDDLVSAQVRRLSDVGRRLGREPAAASTLAEAAELLASHVAEREALFGRGRIAPALRPQEMLEAGLTPRRPIDDPVALRLEDAVSYDGSDYVVRGVLDYFSGGRRWRVYQLHDGKQERWLDARADGAQLAWLQRIREVLDNTGDTVSRDGIEYRVVDRGAAAVGIETSAGRQDGVLVEYRRLTAGPDVLTVEQWPDGQRALAGRTVAREDLDLWTKPAATE